MAWPFVRHEQSAGLFISGLCPLPVWPVGASAAAPVRGSAPRS